MRALFLVSLSLLCCTRATAVVIDAGAPPEECTSATVLVPGVPGSPGHLIASERNPNGASELAALMRTFVDDWRAARVALEADAGVNARLPIHRKIRCTWPTDAADRNPVFDSFAVGYLEKVKAFDAKPSRETYEGVLDGCKACHEVSCGGPLEVIEGLRWAR
ncbi:MAG: hypothetical protein Q8N23_06040 [Archangium sp.]|nr:hypothetical protein [Archangium sp.]MDP3571056.1 hypothetical protein [Archangium sp.]